MNAVEQWKSKTRAARASRQAQEEEFGKGFWGPEKAAWFNRFAGKSDRSHTYRYVQEYVRGQVLEIGPGPGAYTRLMAPVVDRVVAVEPSPFMTALLRENLDGADNIHIVEERIEDYVPRLERYDFALAANVLSGVEPIDDVLRSVTACTTMTAIIMWTNAHTPRWSEAVQREIFQREAPTADMPGHDHLVGVLQELGLEHTVQDVDVPVHTFACQSDVVDWVQGFHGLPDCRRAQLEDVLAPHIEEKGGKYGLLSERRTRVVLVPKAE